ncbi:hypothetical protein YC2023_061824 [Brassica napus]
MHGYKSRSCRIGLRSDKFLSRFLLKLFAGITVEDREEYLVDWAVTEGEWSEQATQASRIWLHLVTSSIEVELQYELQYELQFDVRRLSTPIRSHKTYLQRNFVASSPLYGVENLSSPSWYFFFKHKGSTIRTLLSWPQQCLPRVSQVSSLTRLSPGYVISP